MSHWDKNFHPWAWGLKDGHTNRLSTVNQCTKMARNCGLRLSFVCTAWDLVQVHASEAGAGGGVRGKFHSPSAAWVFAHQNFCSKCSTWLNKQAIYKGPSESKRLKCECQFLLVTETQDCFSMSGERGPGFSGCQVEITKDSTRRPVIRSTTPGFRGYFSTSYLLGIYSYYSN